MRAERAPRRGWSTRELWVGVVETLLRMLPFPAHTGLERIGNPGPQSPVVLTCNFRLTVQLVRRALSGLDVWLLVANSRGVNVWCAATGGLLTDHDVVSVLKTSGVGDKVQHRQVILPQLAATGIDGNAVHRRSGWRVRWGPVEAADIPRFLSAPPEKLHEPRRPEMRAMRTVAFPLTRRIEMAIAWAFPLSVLTGLIVAPFRLAAVLPAVALVWALALAVYLSFPLYGRWLHGSTRRSLAGVPFDIGQVALVLTFWLTLMAGWLAVDLLRGGASVASMAPWALGSLLLLGILGLDLSGSTPLYKSGLQSDRLLQIALDEQACKGAAFCAQVCPKDVFDIDHEQRLAHIARPDECVQCGACIVQCPFDALSFTAPNGSTVPPEVVREYKLNLMGTRSRPKQG